MKIARICLLILLLIFSAMLISSCGSMGAEVWERDILARPEMQFDHRGIDQGIDDHIYFSKEASSGGRGFGGGGCGCN